MLPFAEFAPTHPSLGSTASQFDVMLYGSGCAPQYTGHLVIGLCPPPVLRCHLAPPTITVDCSRSHSRACPPLSLSSRLCTRFDEWTSFCFLRAVSNLFSSTSFPKPFYVVARILWICFPSLLYVLKSHVPTFPSCTHRRTVVQRLIVWYIIAPGYRLFRF